MGEKSIFYYYLFFFATALIPAFLHLFKAPLVEPKFGILKCSREGVRVQGAHNKVSEIRGASSTPFFGTIRAPRGEGGKITQNEPKGPPKAFSGAPLSSKSRDLKNARLPRKMTFFSTWEGPHGSSKSTPRAPRYGKERVGRRE